MTAAGTGVLAGRRVRLTAPFICAGAFVFGLGTLWIEAAWPFAVFQGILCVALLAWLPRALRRPDMVTYRLSLCLPFLVVLIGAMQLWLGHTANAWETRREVLEWATYGVAAFLAFQICLDTHLRHQSVRVFAVFAAGLAIAGVIQNYTSPGRVFWLFHSGYDLEVFGPFLSHGKFANFAELGVAAAMWSAFRARGSLRHLYLGAAAVLVASTVASASRGGVVVIFVELAFLVIVSRRKYSFGVGLALTLGLLVIASTATLGWEPLREKLLSYDVTRDTRWPVNLSSFAMARSFGLTGSGLGTWSTVYPQFARFDAYSEINQAHCDWLQWLIEGGVALVLVLIGMMAAAARAAFKEWWAWGFVFVWLHGLIDYPMQQTPAFAALQVAFWGASVAVLSSAPDASACQVQGRERHD